jgi:hypothetical protein
VLTVVLLIKLEFKTKTPPQLVRQVRETAPIC